MTTQNLEIGQEQRIPLQRMLAIFSDKLTEDAKTSLVEVHNEQQWQAELNDAVDSWVKFGAVKKQAYDLALDYGSTNDYEPSELAIQFNWVLEERNYF